MPTDLERGSPQWWLRRLSSQLHARRQELERFDRYYSGDHPLLFAGEKFREAFGGLFRELADNWCEVVVDAVEERMNVEGFRFGDDPEADTDAWDIWQANNLDGDSQLVHTDALVTGYAYGLVWVDPDDSDEVLITAESPLECIVAHGARNRRDRLAGLKQFIDDDGHGVSFVYLPDGIWRFRTRSPQDTRSVPVLHESTDWQPWSPDGEEFISNPLGLVTLVPFYNRPRLSKPGTGTSELRVVLPVQDAVNKCVADLLVGSEFFAFPQRHATGIQLARDDAGNPVNPFRNVPGAIWADEGELTKFGEFSAANLAHLVGVIDMFIAHIASQTRTPPHYFSSSADRLSGESIKAAETGLVAKTRRKFRYMGEAWEELLRIAFAIRGDDRRASTVTAEVIWGDPESRTEAEHVDAVLKRKALDVPAQQLWEDLDYTPAQIARFRAMRAQDALEGLLAVPSVPAQPTVPQQQPAPVANGNGAPQR